MKTKNITEIQQANKVLEKFTTTLQKTLEYHF